jgi:predicted ATPase
MSAPLDKLTIEGFKSIRKLEDFELRALNVLIGANGAGKSNFVQFFRLLRELIERRLQLAVQTAGGADACLYLGPKVTTTLVAKLCSGAFGYRFTLVPTADNRLVFADEEVLENGAWIPYGSGQAEAKITETNSLAALAFLHHAASGWVAYHFHDTSDTAGVRRQGQINDHEYLRADGGNLAAFLRRISLTNPTDYARIRDVVRLAAPFFNDFKLHPVPWNPDMIQLEWRQKGSDYPLRASQLSDGTLRFICLATALLQPERPPTMLFDEPELGLHPYALALLASLFQQAAEQSGTHATRQVIVSTQSAPLVSEFAPEDIIVVERTRGESVFRRLESTQLAGWLEDYTLGQLWEKNVLGGGPRNERMPLPSDGDRGANPTREKDESSAGDERS